MAGYSELRINPMDSADLSEIENNVEANLGLMKDWIKTVDAPTGRKAVLIGSGPSLKRCLKTGYLHKDMYDPAHWDIFCAKHALPLLMEAGFTNLKCVVLDPRPIEGTSTHDIKRLDLYGAATPDRVEFLVASMTHPSVTNYLLENKFKVTGWHAATKALEKFKDKIKFMIGGGTNSILRAVGIAKDCYGAREIFLLGIDCSIEDPPKADENDPTSYLYTAKDPITNSPKYLKSFFGPGEGWNSNKYLAKWTTGELAASLQDLEQFFQAQKEIGITLRIIGTDKGRTLSGQLADFFGC